MPKLLCDFCSEPDPAWGYPTLDFMAYVCGQTRGVSRGGWSACSTCHDMIEAGNLEALVARTMQTLPLEGDDEQIWDFVKDLHRKFFEHRCGPAVPAAAEGLR